MKQVWVDATDLFEWEGYFTGIQRVTYNYAQRFSQDGTKFFVYSSHYKRFIEIPFDLLEQKQIIAAAAEQITKRQTVKRKLKNHYVMLPKVVRSVSSPVLGRANAAFRKGAAMALDHKHRDTQIKSYPTAIFSEGDSVLLLGAGWNSGRLIDELTILKEAKNIRIALHLNDILPVYQPHLFAKELPALFTPYIKKGLRACDVVTVISKATADDIKKFCTEEDIATPPIEIIRLGENLTTASPEKPTVELADKFILSVGTFEIRKNYQILYQAVKLAQSEGRELPQIVIAGRKGWLTKDLQYVLEHDPSIAGKLILLEGMHDTNLAWLYENCQFTVFCSLVEGWGLPIAESLQYGKFCLSSNTSSMPEIAGDKIAYFNPYDSRDCMEKIVEYADQDMEKLNASLRSVYKPLSWDQSYASLRQKIHAVL